MIDIKINLQDFDELQRKLSDMPRQLENATQRALLKTAHAIKDAEFVEMQRVFDRPTRWTLGAMKIKATGLMSVSVGVLDPDGFYKRAQNYLSTQITGGQRKLKAFEKSLQARGLMPPGWFAVPGAGAKRWMPTEICRPGRYGKY